MALRIDEVDLICAPQTFRTSVNLLKILFYFLNFKTALLQQSAECLNIPAHVNKEKEGGGREVIHLRGGKEGKRLCTNYIVIFF